MNFTEVIARFQLIPLLAFALLSRFFGQGNQAYFFAFNIGTILAIAQMAAIYIQGVLIDRMALGANLFLLGGSLSILLYKAGFGQLLHFYGTYTFTTFFFGLILAGIITTLFSTYGYLGIYSSNRQAIRYYSWMLLICTIVPAGILVALKSLNPSVYKQFGLYLVTIFFITLNYVRDYFARHVLES